MIVVYNNRIYENNLLNKIQKILIKVQVCNLNILECNFEYYKFNLKFRYLF